MGQAAPVAPGMPQFAPETFATATPRANWRVIVHHNLWLFVIALALLILALVYTIGLITPG